MAKYAAVITGATGFVGSRIAAELISDGAEVRVLTSGTADRTRLGDLSDRVHWWPTDDVGLTAATRDATCFFNLAVAYDRSTVDDAALQAVNIDLPLRVLAHLRQQGQPVTCVLGDTFFRKFPPEATRQARYTRSKIRLAEHLYEVSRGPKNPLRIALLLMEQVYGPGDAFTKVLPALTSQLLRNVPRLATTHGRQQRDFVHIDDVAAAVMAVSRADWQGLQQVECGTGVATPVREVLERLKKLTGSRTELGFGDLPSDQFIDVSLADTTWLCKRDWTPRVRLEVGLKTLVQDTALRLGEASP